MILIYRFLTTFFYPLLIFFIYCRKIIGKEDKTRFVEKIFSYSFFFERDKNKKLIWFHAASIGEAKSIFSLVQKLKEENSELEFLITTITLSSGNLVKKKFEVYKNIHHRYLPIDVNFLVKKFLNIWKPNLIIFVDSEIWPNLIFEINKRKIPSAIINGRITEKSFKKWMKVPSFAKQIFGTFNLSLASSKKSKEYLEKLGAKNLKYIGNLKLSETIDENEIINENKEILKDNNFWVAASTHEGEENLCLKTHINLKKEFQNLKTIIIPRHINRSNKIKLLCDNLNLAAQILNENDKIINHNEIIIVNSFGSLTKYFKYSKSVFIGKTLLKRLENEGGQNPVEAAKLNCKIYHGPYVKNFEEIYNLLRSLNITFEINNEDELSKKLKYDFENLNTKENVSSKINILGNKILNDSIKEINRVLN